MFGILLENARKSKGLTMQELSNIFRETYGLNVTKSMISRWENSQSTPTIKYLAAYSKYFNLDINLLIDTNYLFSSENQLYFDRLDFVSKRNDGHYRVDEFNAVLNVQQIVKDRIPPTVENLHHFARVFNVSIFWLLGFSPFTQKTFYDPNENFTPCTINKTYGPLGMPMYVPINESKKDKDNSKSLPPIIENIVSLASNLSKEDQNKILCYAEFVSQNAVQINKK
mgnify:CR=1 FL=1|nr:MAG TPA: helix-turn-helix domain protein [Caudoviricetes sp.]